jgi:hypothetical protein
VIEYEMMYRRTMNEIGKEEKLEERMNVDGLRKDMLRHGRNERFICDIRP